MGESKFHWKTTYRVLRILEVNAQFLYIYLMQYDSLQFWEPSINYVVSGKGRGYFERQFTKQAPFTKKRWQGKRGSKIAIFRKHDLQTAPCCLTLPAFSRVKTVKGEGKKNYTKAILYPLSTCAVQQQWLLMHIAQNLGVKDFLSQKSTNQSVGGKKKNLSNCHGSNKLRAQITYYFS